MRKLRNSIPFFLLLFTFAARAQNTEVILNYINTYKELAIQEMQRTGVPAAIKLAQGIHETTAGTSDLVQKSNNHFGIKCKDTWTGASVFHDDDSRGECFRKYPSAIDSYRDHSDFLKSSDRYSFLFKLEPTDYKDWAYGLKRAGYATNPRYPQIIIGLIEDYHLQDYTLMALGKMAAPENAIVKTTIENGQRQTGPSFVIKQEETIKQPEKIIDRPSYPEGTEFRINDTRVIYAKKGTSFLAIAQEYNVPLARLFEFNDMSQSETVNKDQLIYLQRKRKTGSNEFHTIQAGETLYDIAQLEAIRLETLLEYNLLRQDMKPAIGEQLNLRTKAAAMPRLALKENYSLYSSPAGSIAMNTYASENAKAQTTTVYCTVKPKETIYAISKRYNVNIDDIVKWNQLGGYDLKTGQQLKIYK
ncbi:MAG TPA: glucosaminidase domain-containing protein [Chitinophagaceae bacterium]|nr:glucosaminidase domain-containing protein [Chitinophagaceae bacterium]